MATVYLGRMSGMAGFQKLVAVKVIHPHLIAQEKFVDMFLDEARLSARIHHPNVIEIFEVDEVDGLYFMVVELVRGQSLKELLRAANRSKKPLTPELSLTIVALVCDALHAAHTLKEADGSPLGLVHRDVSPSNIMISYDGVVKLIDFGIAFAKGRSAETGSGVVKGKLDYMAPEQLRGKPADRRNDVFSVGIVLYLLATGCHPFSGADEAERLGNLLKCRPASPSAHVPDIDPQLERTILKALAEDPDHRHQTTKELGRELRTLLVPRGGLVDHHDIADLMAELFAEEIAQDEPRYQQTMEMGSSIEGEGEQEGHLGGEDEPLAQTGSLPPQDTNLLTEVMSPPDESFEKPRNHRAMFLVFVIVAAVVVGLLVWPFGNRASEAKPALAAFRELKVELNKIRLTNPSKVPSAQAKATWSTNDKRLEDLGREPQSGHSEAAPQTTSVKLRLKGLPNAAKVQLDGNDLSVVAGQVAVPADGVERELQVTAPGYRPFYRKIKPSKDGEIIVELPKKRAPPPNPSHNPERKGKTGPNNSLQGCPYCE